MVWCRCQFGLFYGIVYACTILGVQQCDSGKLRVIMMPTSYGGPVTTKLASSQLLIFSHWEILSESHWCLSNEGIWHRYKTEYWVMKLPTWHTLGQMVKLTSNWSHQPSQLTVCLLKTIRDNVRHWSGTFPWWHCHIDRADFRFVPSPWETALLYNDVSHWLGASQESTLHGNAFHIISSFSGASTSH